jgi:hypothetical protein
MFNPRKHYGANQARFQNYINLCLMNKFRTLYSKRMEGCPVPARKCVARHTKGMARFRLCQ